MDLDWSAVTKLYDVFICHASEDKDDFVRPLAEALRSHHLEVWYDEFALDVGDSLREAIDRGLATSRYGIVVLSPSFFRKRWPRRELNGLVARETGEDRAMILRVWHRVDRDEVLAFSPPLADLWAAVSASGISTVVGQLLKKLQPESDPLVVARDMLIERGLLRWPWFVGQGGARVKVYSRVKDRAAKVLFNMFCCSGRAGRGPSELRRWAGLCVGSPFS